MSTLNNHISYSFDIHKHGKQLSIQHQLKALCWINLLQTIQQGPKVILGLVSPLLWTFWFTSIHSHLRKRVFCTACSTILAFPSLSSSMELSGVCIWTLFPFRLPFILWLSSSFPCTALWISNQSLALHLTCLVFLLEIELTLYCMMQGTH